MSELGEQGYLNLLKDIMENGVIKEDRTGTGTKSLYGKSITFDLQKGFPLFTTKRIHMKSVIGELIWFLKGETNISYLKDNKIRIWDEWADNNGDLGPVYPQMWRRIQVYDSDEIIQVEPRLDFINNKPFQAPIQIASSSYLDPDDFDQKIFETNQFGQVKVLGVVSRAKNTIYEVQFQKTGSIIKVSRPNLRNGMVADPYAITTASVGCVGVSTSNPHYYNRAYDLWRNMILRCHDINNIGFPLYGGRGIFVHADWRCFANFLHDLPQIPFFDKWESGFEYELDKDYFVSNCYSKFSCCFLSRSFNIALSNKDYKAFEAVNEKKNIKERHDSIKRFAAKYNLNEDNVSACLNKRRNDYKDWTFSYLQSDNGKVFRRRIMIDQVSDIISSLVSDPKSRRHIINSWNVSDLKRMALTPCHALVQFHCDEKNGKIRLSCTMYQRSADMFLGVPFNCASYALLTHMLAQVLNYDAGSLTLSFGDCHIYSNHFVQVEEQLKRQAKSLPLLELDQSIKSIDDFTLDSFKIVGYDPHPIIKGQVAV